MNPSSKYREMEIIVKPYKKIDSRTIKKREFMSIHFA